MKVTIDHVGIAVSNLDDALSFYRDALGLEVEQPEDVPSQAVRVHLVHLAEAAGVAERGEGVKIELLEATANDSPIAKYIAKRGPGIHHLTFRVDDIVSALAQLKARGVRLIDDVPRRGAHGSQIAFIHPASTHGVLIELKQG